MVTTTLLSVYRHAVEVGRYAASGTGHACWSCQLVWSGGDRVLLMWRLWEVAEVREVRKEWGGRGRAFLNELRSSSVNGVW